VQVADNHTLLAWVIASSKSRPISNAITVNNNAVLECNMPELILPASDQRFPQVVLAALQHQGAEKNREWL